MSTLTPEQRDTAYEYALEGATRADATSRHLPTRKHLRGLQMNDVELLLARAGT